MNYRMQVYKILFWIFCQCAVLIAFTISGDILRKTGVSFSINVKEGELLNHIEVIEVKK